MTQGEIPQAMEQATRHHQSGRLREAENIYVQVLEIDPVQPDALQLLGVLSLQIGKVAVAINLIGRAVAIKPDAAYYHYNLGQALASAGKLDDAIASYRRALELQPDLADAHNGIGDVLLIRQQLPQAIEAFRRAIALRPGFAEAHSNLGNALAAKGQHELAIVSFNQALALSPDSATVLTNLGSSLQALGQTDEALAALTKAVALQPNLAEAHNNLGIILQTLGRLDQAIASYRKAIALRNDFADAHSNLGSALLEIGQHQQAISEYRRALAIRPDSPEVHNNLGSALRKTGRIDEAIAAFRQAIARYPAFYEPTVNLGAAFHDSGQIDEAIETFRRAIQLRPDRASAHVNLGFDLLLKGELAPGWSEYEWRWKAGQLKYPHDDSGRPRWDGRKLSGQRILIETEPDPGDTIQFVRYLPQVAARGGRITLACDAELEKLLQANFPQIRLSSRNEPLVEFETHCPLISLARIFGTTLKTIPATVPYLRVDAAKSQNWRKRLAQFSEPRKIGLLWSDKAENSLPPNILAPLFKTPGVRFVSLKKSLVSAPELPLIDWTDKLKDFSDTAALIDQLDLIITIDSAIAHLAGAMGKPTWVLLPKIPDWRWLLNRSDSPWYPTMRLFRQTKTDDWGGVITEIARVLADFPAQSVS